MVGSQFEEYFYEKAARIFERNGDRYIKPTTISSYGSLGVYGIFTRQQLIHIAEEILELEGFVILRGVTRKSLLKEIAQRFTNK